MTASKVAIVTDALHFVGPSVVKELIGRGFRVFAHDVSFSVPGARSTFDAESPGATALAAPTPEAIVGEVLAAEGNIDALILNDAYPALRAPVDEASGDDLRATYETLVFRAFELVGQTVPHMKSAGHGRIVFVTSAAPLQGLANYTMYASARGAANALSRSLAIELAPNNITVNAIAPNFVESPTYFPPSLMEKPEAAAKILKNIPLGRLGKPDEVARVVGFLADGESDFVTGQTISLAGGWS